MKAFLLATSLLFVSQVAVAEQPFRQMAAEAIGAQLVDPFSVKKAMVSKPFQYKNAIVVCAKFYAKNRMGGYSGLSYWSVVFTKDGSRVKFAHDVTGKSSDCEKSAFTRFTELENF